MTSEDFRIKGFATNVNYRNPSAQPALEVKELGPPLPMSRYATISLSIWF